MAIYESGKAAIENQLNEQAYLVALMLPSFKRIQSLIYTYETSVMGSLDTVLILIS